jgi:hypothetical protein
MSSPRTPGDWHKPPSILTCGNGVSEDLLRQFDNGSGVGAIDGIQEASD